MMSRLETAINYYNTATTIVSKTTAVYVSASDVYNRCKKDKLTKEDKIAICAQSVFCILQLGDLGLYAATKFNQKGVEKFVGGEKKFRNISFGLTLATGVADVAKTITITCVNDMEALPALRHIVGVVIYRAQESIAKAEALGMIPNEDQEKCESANAGSKASSVVHEDKSVAKAEELGMMSNEDQEKCEPAKAGLNASSAVSEDKSVTKTEELKTKPKGNRKVLYTKAALNTASLALEIYNNWDDMQAGTRVVLRAFQDRIKKKHTGNSAQVESSTTSASPSQPQVPAILAPEHIKNTQELNDYFGAMIRAIHNWKTEKKIHPDLKDEPSLEIFKCGISQHPARFLVSPKSETAQLIFYDKEILEDWIKTKPNEAPPHWPNNLPFTRDNFKENKACQGLLDLALANLSEKYRGYERK